jgi:hypothetical protein
MFSRAGSRAPLNGVARRLGLRERVGRGVNSALRFLPAGAAQPVYRAQKLTESVHG